ncbi:MAG: hypothetical protein LBH35_11330 [Treponema sp.]|jgi:hypothetical protein|nr:hypothetical protein [Treponema sp.]
MKESSVAQVIIAIIPMVGIVMSSIVAFFYLLWHHRRKILLIKAGQYHNNGDFDLLSFSLLTGLLLASVGAGLTVFFALIDAGYGLLGGIIPLALGAGLLAFYFVRRGEHR